MIAGLIISNSGQQGEANSSVLNHFTSVFNCGTVTCYARDDHWMYRVTKLNNNIDLIAPYFQKFGLMLLF